MGLVGNLRGPQGPPGAGLSPGTRGTFPFSDPTQPQGLGWGRPANLIDPVKEFGAKFDGTTDDTAALTAALGAGPGLVQMPPGTAILSSLTAPLTIPPGVSLRGAGAGQTGLNATKLQSFVGPIIKMAGAASVASDFALFYDASGTTNKNDGIEVDDTYPWGQFSFLGGTAATLQNLLVWNVAGRGVVVNGLEVRLINVYVKAKALSTGKGSHGFHILQTDNMLIGCTADHCGADGFRIEGANTKVSTSKAFGCLGSGFTLGGSGRHMLSSCEAQDNNIHGFSDLNSAGYNTLAACVADTNGVGGGVAYGFRLMSPSTAVGCHALNRTGSSQTYGFSTYAGTRGPAVVIGTSALPGVADVDPSSVGYVQVNNRTVWTTAPVVDPHVAGQMWSNGGILTLSAG